MNAPARTAPRLSEHLCPKCRGLLAEECRLCHGELFLRVEPIEPEAVPRVHRYAEENASVRIRAALIDGNARRTDVDYISVGLARALSVLCFRRDRAALIQAAEEFVSSHAEACVTAFVNALEETAANFRDEARRADGPRRREKDATARVLEALVERLEA